MIVSYEVAIIGAGIGGCVLAHDLSEAGVNVALIDRGPVCSGSSALNAGGMRHQFSNELNVTLAKRAISRISALQRDDGQNLGFRQVGYAFLLSRPETANVFRDVVQLQRSCGVPTEFLEPTDIEALIPGSRVDDLIGGTFCPLDGYVSPRATVSWFANSATALGTTIFEKTKVTAIDVVGGRAVGVHCESGQRISADVIVNAGGVWSPTVANLYGGELPITPWRSQIFIFSQTPDLHSPPVVIDFDNKKTWFHTTEDGFMAGINNCSEARRGLRLKCDWTKLPDLIDTMTARVPKFADAVVRRGWAGFLELTPDDNPIVGWTHLDNLYTFAGFSGHAFSLVPGLAPEASNEIRGMPTTMSLEAFRLERFGNETSENDPDEKLSMR